MSMSFDHVRVAPSPRPDLWQDYSKTRRFVLNKLAVVRLIEIATFGVAVLVLAALCAIDQAGYAGLLELVRAVG